MPFLAGRGAWPSALSRARSLRLSERSERPLTGEAGGPGAGFQQEGRNVSAVMSESIWQRTRDSEARGITTATSSRQLCGQPESVSAIQTVTSLSGDLELLLSSR